MEEEILQQEEAVEQEQDMLVEAPESVSEPVSQEGNTIVGGEALQQRREPPRASDIVAPIPLSFGDEDQGVVLDFGELQSFLPVRTPEATKDIVNVSKLVLGDTMSNPQTTSEVEQIERQAVEAVKQKRDEQLRIAAENEILNADMEEQVLDTVERLSIDTGKPILLSELNREALLAQFTPSEDIYLRPAEEIGENLRLAAITARAQERIWNETGWWDLSVDILEMLDPTISISERRDKMTVADAGWVGFITMGGSYEDLARRLEEAPPEKRESIVNKMIEEIVAQETILFSNGNSLLRADQLALLEQALRDGFAAYTNGSTVDKNLEYILAAIDIPVVAGILKGAKGFVRGLSRKLFGAKEAPQYAGARPQGGRHFDDVNAANPVGVRVQTQESMGTIRSIKEAGFTDFGTVSRFLPARDIDGGAVVPTIQYRGKTIPLESAKKILEDLRLRATGKLSRGERKRLDAERKQVGDEVARLEADSKTYRAERVGIYRQQGMNPKQASRQADKDVAARKRELMDKRAYLNNVIRQSDEYAQAEANASRLEQAIASGVEYTPYNLVKIPKPRVGEQPAARTAKEIVSDFDSAVDEAVEDTLRVQRDLEWSAPDPRAIEDSIRDMGKAAMVDPEKYGAIIDRTADRISRLSGSRLKHNPADTLWKANDDPDSIGTFRILLGDGDEGFKSAEEARLAAKAALGEDLRPVQKNGKWWLEKEFTHKYDPRKDWRAIDTSRVSSLNPLASWLINPLRKLGSSNLRDLWGNIEANRSMAANILEPAKKAIKRLNDGEAERVSKLLHLGDEKQQVFTRSEAAKELGRNINDKEWEAYKRSREVFDAHYDVINNNLRKRLDADGYRFLPTPDPKEGYFVKPLTNKQLSEITDDTMVWDAVNGREVRAKEVLEEGRYMLFDAHVSPKRAESGRYTIVAGSPDDVRGLPQSVVVKRVGHVTRSYVDRKFKVVQKVREKVNGEYVIRERTLAITRLEGEGNEVVDLLRKEDPNLEDVEPLRVVPTRENPSDDVAAYMDDLDIIGMVSSNVRKRGEQLLGAGMNPARIANPIDSLVDTQRRLTTELNRDVTATLEAQFMDAWRDFLTDIEGKTVKVFPREGQLRFREGTPTSVERQIRNFHDYIVGMDKMKKGKIAEAIESTLNAFEEAIFRRTGKQLPESVRNIIDSDAQRAFMRLATNAYIIGRPLFQVPTNMLQTLNIMMRYPASGTKSAARAFAVAAALASRNSDDFSVLFKKLSKMGYTDKQIDDLLNLIDETGIVNTTGNVDDYLGLAEGGFKSTTKLGGVARIATAPIRGFGRAGSRALDAAGKAQELSISYVNLVGLLAEYDQAIAKGVKMTARNKNEILLRARQLTQTQNSLDQFGYQEGHNPFQMMFQFVQHVNKIFLDIAVEPWVKAILDRGLVKGNEGIFAETRGVAVRTAALTFAIFGMNGLPIGSEAASSSTNFLREAFINAFGKDLPDAVWNTIQGGLINGMVNMAIDGEVDITARVSPSAFVDAVRNMFNDVSLDIFGAAGGITESVLDIGFAAKTIASTPELDTLEKGKAILLETATFFAGFKDYEKSLIARTWLSQPYASTLSGPMRVTYEEAVFSMFSINPKSVQQLYDMSDFSGGKTKDHVRKVSEVFIRQMNRELTEAKADGQLEGNEGFFRQNEIVRKWVEYAKANVDSILYDEVEDYFQGFMIQENGEGFRNFIKPYLDGQDRETRIERLRRLRNDVEFEDYRELIDAQLWMLGDKQ